MDSRAILVPSARWNGGRGRPPYFMPCLRNWSPNGTFPAFPRSRKPWCPGCALKRWRHIPGKQQDSSTSCDATTHEGAFIDQRFSSAGRRDGSNTLTNGISGSGFLFRCTSAECARRYTTLPFRQPAIERPGVAYTGESGSRVLTGFANHTEGTVFAMTEICLIWSDLHGFLCSRRTPACSRTEKRTAGRLRLFPKLPERGEGRACRTIRCGRTFQQCRFARFARRAKGHLVLWKLGPVRGVVGPYKNGVLEGLPYCRNGGLSWTVPQNTTYRSWSKAFSPKVLRARFPAPAKTASFD